MRKNHAKASPMRKYLQAATNKIRTENGAVAYKSTGNALLDFFALGGAMRGRNEDEILALFAQAFIVDPLRALKAAFYFRDIRGGQGERDLTRLIFRYLAEVQPDKMLKNMHLIPEYGRWDDLLVFFGTKLEGNMLALIGGQIQKELSGAAKISLIWKWLPSINTSNRDARMLAHKIAKFLGWTPKFYRKTLTAKRAELRIVEVQMTAQKWDQITYEHVPSRAMMGYRKAFGCHDQERFGEYLGSLKKGEKKVNAKTLYPYDIIRTVANGGCWDNHRDLYEAQWAELVKVFSNKANALAIVDTSASMKYENNALALYSAIALGMLLAETNHGPWANAFIDFNQEPTFRQITGNTLFEKIRSVLVAAGRNTNIQAVFQLLLRIAQQYKLTQEDMPKKLVMISDMEFDAERKAQAEVEDPSITMSQCHRLGPAFTGDTSKALFDRIREEWRAAGYDLPILVFWNVNARQKQVPATKDDRGIIFVSGHSPAIFKNILKDEMKDAVQVMLDVLDSERYAAIAL